MAKMCENVIKRNKAALTYVKSIFNPNKTYIGYFANGYLIEDEDYLFY